MKTTSIILAAGQGTRMKSDLPKILHPVCGKAMIWHALQAVRDVTDENAVVVIGHGAQHVRELVGDTARFVVQAEQQGTGHAVQQAESALKDNTNLVLVTSADLPLLTSDTLGQLIETQKRNPGPVTMLTVISDNSRGFGRVLRKENGSVHAIVEEAQATKDELAIKELNVGAYCFDGKWLWEALNRITL